MADTPISSDVTLTGAQIAGGDLVPVVDISEAAAADKNKNTTFAHMVTYQQSNLLHDSFSDYVSNEHIDWTAASSNFDTSGSVTVGGDLIIDAGVTAAILKRDVNSDFLFISGSNTSANGGGIKLWGSTSTPAGDVEFYSGGVMVGSYDNSESRWDFGTANIRTDGSVLTDAVDEYTAAAGVTVDGLLIKDNKLATNDSVVSSNITNDAVTYAKIQNVAADDVLLGNIAGVNGIVAELTATQVRTMINVADGSIAEVVSDTTPELGGPLDVGGNKIVSATNGDIDIEPDGTGNVLLGNFTFDADQSVGAGQDNYVLTYDNGTGLISLETGATDKPIQMFVVALGDETTEAVTGTGVIEFRLPYGFTVTEYYLWCNGPPTGTKAIIDINEGGVSVLGTKLSIDATEDTSVTAAVSATITDAAIAYNAKITIDFDQVGSTYGGDGFKLGFYGTRT